GKFDGHTVITTLVLADLHVADLESFSRYGHNRCDRSVSGRLGSFDAVGARAKPRESFSHEDPVVGRARTRQETLQCSIRSQIDQLFQMTRGGSASSQCVGQKWILRDNGVSLAPWVRRLG